jgi:hypothetical protein
MKFVPMNALTGQMGQPLVTSELIDAIAMGAKLTKADAAKAFPVAVYTDPVEVETSFYSYGYPNYVRLEVSGLDSDQIEVSINGGLDYGNPVNVTADQWANITPTNVKLRANWTSAGAKVALLKFLDSSNNLITSMDLTGAPTA